MEISINQKDMKMETFKPVDRRSSNRGVAPELAEPERFVASLEPSLEERVEKVKEIVRAELAKPREKWYPITQNDYEIAQKMVGKMSRMEALQEIEEAEERGECSDVARVLAIYDILTQRSDTSRH